MDTDNSVTAPSALLSSKAGLQLVLLRVLDDDFSVGALLELESDVRISRLLALDVVVEWHVWQPLVSIVVVELAGIATLTPALVLHVEADLGLEETWRVNGHGHGLKIPSSLLLCSPSLFLSCLGLLGSFKVQQPLPLLLILPQLGLPHVLFFSLNCCFCLGLVHLLSLVLQLLDLDLQLERLHFLLQLCQLTRALLDALLVLVRWLLGKVVVGLFVS